jgi:hypothetical protein
LVRAIFKITASKLRLLIALKTGHELIFPVTPSLADKLLVLSYGPTLRSFLMKI